MTYQWKGPSPEAGAEPSEGDLLASGITDDTTDKAPYSQGYLCTASQAAAVRSDAIVIAAWRRLMSHDAQYRRAELMGSEPFAVREREKAAAARRASLKLRRCRTCGHLSIKSKGAA